ncbi:hypothetical protein M2404_003520 [Rheinheimera pacifica]|uniref:hypothetical protein n=1 Tax=Rheinheimera pacifica TaxID=173990 RepID=UPI0021687C85|nr:hypothetical protein [Rheinheimera pacifica]MCS4309157.1 hypothetical protein [Rheinheimera pacifica]
MTYYRVISSNYRFGRVLDEYVNKYMPKDILPLVEYLRSEHGLELDGIYLENYKSPDRIIVMKGMLPIEDLRVKFPEGGGLRYGNGVVVSDASFSSLEGA